MSLESEVPYLRDRFEIQDRITSRPRILIIGAGSWKNGKGEHPQLRTWRTARQPRA